jgi:hypothetical protein
MFLVTSIVSLRSGCSKCLEEHLRTASSPIRWHRSFIIAERGKSQSPHGLIHVKDHVFQQQCCWRRAKSIQFRVDHQRWSQLACSRGKLGLICLGGGCGSPPGLGLQLLPFHYGDPLLALFNSGSYLMSSPFAHLQSAPCWQSLTKVHAGLPGRSSQHRAAEAQKLHYRKKAGRRGDNRAGILGQDCRLGGHYGSFREYPLLSAAFQFVKGSCGPGTSDHWCILPMP